MSEVNLIKGEKFGSILGVSCFSPCSGCFIYLISIHVFLQIRLLHTFLRFILFLGNVATTAASEQLVVIGVGAGSGDSQPFLLTSLLGVWVRH